MDNAESATGLLALQPALCCRIRRLIASTPRNHTRDTPKSHTRHPEITHETPRNHTRDTPQSHTRRPEINPEITHETPRNHTRDTPKSHTRHPEITHETPRNHTRDNLKHGQVVSSCVVVFQAVFLSLPSLSLTSSRSLLSFLSPLSLPSSLPQPSVEDREGDGSFMRRDLGEG